MTQSGGGYGSLTLAYQSATSSANQLRFRATSAGAGNTDVLTVSTLNTKWWYYYEIQRQQLQVTPLMQH